MKPSMVYPDLGENIAYPALGAADENAEFIEKVLRLAVHLGGAVGKVKKLQRDCGVNAMREIVNLTDDLDVLTEEDRKRGQEAWKLREGALKELGDAYWYMAALAKVELASSMSEVARMIVEKVQDRAKRGVLGGSGDNR